MARKYDCNVNLRVEVGQGWCDRPGSRSRCLRQPSRKVC